MPSPDVFFLLLHGPSGWARHGSCASAGVCVCVLQSSCSHLPRSHLPRSHLPCSHLQHSHMPHSHPCSHPSGGSQRGAAHLPGTWGSRGRWWWAGWWPPAQAADFRGRTQGCTWAGAEQEVRGRAGRGVGVKWGTRQMAMRRRRRRRRWWWANEWGRESMSRRELLAGLVARYGLGLGGEEVHGRQPQPRYMVRAGARRRARA